MDIEEKTDLYLLVAGLFVAALVAAIILISRRLGRETEDYELLKTDYAAEVSARRAAERQVFECASGRIQDANKDIEFWGRLFSTGRDAGQQKAER